MSANNQVAFESERLRLRRFENKDFSDLFAYRNDEEVAKYQSWTDKTEEQIQALIDEKPTLGTIDEWFTFAIATKDTDKLIGECAFCINKNFPTQAEMGITLSRNAQGKKYANEAMTAILNYLFTNTQIEHIIFITFLKNTSCISLLKKLHASRQIELDEVVSHEKYNQYGLQDTEVMFSISKTHWQPGKSDKQSLQK